MKKQTAKHPSLALFALMSCLGGCGLIVRQATIAYIAVNSLSSPKEVEIEINKSFIEKYKNRAAIHR